MRHTIHSCLGARLRKRTLGYAYAEYVWERSVTVTVTGDTDEESVVDEEDEESDRVERGSAGGAS